jgi:hypothetical protein
MKKLFVLLLMIGTAWSTGLHAQVIVAGDLKFLKGASGVNVIFDYKDLTFGRDGSEDNFVKRKKDEYNTKEAGSGDAWEEKWNADKEKIYKPRFIDLLFKYANWQLNEDAREKYTLVVSTKYIETGYNIKITQGAARLDLEFTFYDAGDTDRKNALCRIMLEDVRGGKGQSDTGARIGETYGRAGKELGMMIKKKAR